MARNFQVESNFVGKCQILEWKVFYRNALGLTVIRESQAGFSHSCACQVSKWNVRDLGFTMWPALVTRSYWSWKPCSG